MALLYFKGIALGDWLSALTVIGSLIFFIFGIYSTNQTQALQLNSLNQDVAILKDSIPAIERSLGRIEGTLGIKESEFANKSRRPQ